MKGHSNRAAIRVQSFGDVLDRFRNHPESKSAGADGLPAGPKTVGLLRRLHVHALSISHIGKATNLLEAQQEGVLVSDPQAVYVGGGEWETIRPYLNQESIFKKLAAITGISKRTLRAYRQGARKPKPERLEVIKAALVRVLDDSRG